MSVPGIPILNDKYPSTMDLYPLQDPEFNRIHPFYENLRENRLTTTRCQDCGAVSFPPRVVCPQCNSENLEWVDLPTKGKVLQFSEEVAGVPLGWQPPLIHALIDLGNGMNFLSRMENCQAGDLKEGDEVRLLVYEIPPMIKDSREGPVECPRVFYAFEPVK